MFIRETALHVTLVVCWTFLVVTDSQTTEPMSNVSATQGVCAAALCALAGLTFEAVWWSWSLRAPAFALLAAGVALLANGDDAWIVAIATALLIAITARSVRNEVLQLHASIPSVDAFDKQYLADTLRNDDSDTLRSDDSDDPKVRLGKAFDSALSDEQRRCDALLQSQVLRDKRELELADELFEIFDQDQDGHLNAQEYGRYVAVIGESESPRRIYGSAMRYSPRSPYRTHLDYDQEKYISRDAFCEFYGLQRQYILRDINGATDISSQEGLRRRVRRPTRLVDDFCKARGITGLTAQSMEWIWRNEEAARTRSHAEDSDHTLRRRQQRYTVGLQAYLDDFWCEL